MRVFVPAPPASLAAPRCARCEKRGIGFRDGQGRGEGHAEGWPHIAAQIATKTA